MSRGEPPSSASSTNITPHDSIKHCKRGETNKGSDQDPACGSQQGLQMITVGVFKLPHDPNTCDGTSLLSQMPAGMDTSSGLASSVPEHSPPLVATTSGNQQGGGTHAPPHPTSRWQLAFY